jgi:hypothetical protein
MTVNFGGNVYDDAGNAVSGASVKLLETGTTTQEGSTVTTDSAGRWDFLEADQDRYDVEITKGSSVRRIKWSDEISLQEIDVRNSTGATTPAATFTNLTNNAANQVAVFSGANSTRADGDEIYLSFKLADSAGNIDEFARITAEAVDVTSGQEDGQLRFGVAKTDGTIVDVFTINSTTGGETSMTFDVSGDLTLDADGGDIFLKDGGTLFGTLANSSGELVIKSSSSGTTAATFSGANVTFAGTIGSGAITSTGIVTGTGFTAGNAVLAEAELELLDGLTAGTAIASKVVTTDASIDTSGQRNLTISGELDAATLDLSSSADIAGDLVLSGGADGALQFTNAGENSIKIPDNQASALIIEEANNAYITFVTTNSSEAITVAKATTFSAGIADAGTIAAGTWNGTAITGAYVNDDIISGQSEITSGLAAADELLYSDAGTVMKVGLDNLTTYLAGVNAGTVTSTGLSDSSGVITLDIQSMTASSTIADADLIVIDDGAGGTLRKMTRANFIESAALDAVNIDGGAIDGTVIGANSAAAGTFAAIVGTTVTASTNFTRGDTIITDGVITDSTGLQIQAVVDLNANALNNVGAAGNDWSANTLQVSSANTGGSNLIYVENTNNSDEDSHAIMKIEVGGSSGGDPKIWFIGTGYSMAMGMDNSESSRFALGVSADLGGADALRIVAATHEITFQNQGADFDYVCDTCSRHSHEPFVCHGQVAPWHEDMPVLLARNTPTGLQQLVNLGVYEVDGPEADQPGWTGINFQQSTHFTWSAMAQMYEEFDRRLAAIGG